MQLTTKKVCRHAMHGTHATSIRFERENGWQITQGPNCKGNWIEDLTECIDKWNRKCEWALKDLALVSANLLYLPVGSLDGWITALGFYREAWHVEKPKTETLSLKVDTSDLQKTIRESITALTPANHLAFDFGRDVSENQIMKLCEGVKNRDVVTAFNALHYLLIR